MATVTFAVSKNNTANTNSYACTSITPAVNDLLVVFSQWNASIEPGATFACTDDQSGTYSKIRVALRSSSTGSVVAFVRTALVASAVGHIITVTNVGDNATNNGIHVYRVSGMSVAGTSAVRQSAMQENQALGTTPAPVFGSTTLTGNPVLGCVGSYSTSPAVVHPTGWTEGAEDNPGTPDTTTESVFVSSGFVGTTVTWGGNSAGLFAAVILELASGTMTNQAVDAGSTLTAALVRVTRKPLAATVTLTAALVRQTAKFVAVAATLTADAVKRVTKAIAAGITATVDLVKIIAGTTFYQTIETAVRFIRRTPLD